VFDFNVQPSLDLQHHLEKKAAQLQRKGLQLQPHVVVLCNTMDDIGMNCAYACLHSGVYYCATTVLEAVDICIKAAFVFGLDYPQASRSAWSFVQRSVYGICHKYDHRLPSRAQELLTDIQ